MRSWTKLCGVVGGVMGLMGVLATQASANAPNLAASVSLASSSGVMQMPEPILGALLLAGLAAALWGVRKVRPAAVRQRINLPNKAK